MFDGALGRCSAFLASLPTASVRRCRQVQQLLFTECSSAPEPIPWRARSIPHQYQQHDHHHQAHHQYHRASKSLSMLNSSNFLSPNRVSSCESPPRQSETVSHEKCYLYRSTCHDLRRRFLSLDRRRQLSNN